MRYKGLNLFASICAACLLISCGGGGDKAAPEAQKSSTPKTAQVISADMTAAITGTINFKGSAPARKKVKQDRECSAFHTESVLSEGVIVNANGTLKNVFVYIKEGLGDRKFDPSAEPVVLDQKGCMYEPHVFGVQTGQNIKILNSDPLLHNIHALPKKNRPFNFGMPKKGDVRERSFKVHEVMVKIKCDVHPWMGAYAGVLEHPYHSVSGDDGTFSLKNLPPGDYVVEAWHETYGTMKQNITVGDNETKTTDFTFEGPSS